MARELDDEPQGNPRDLEIGRQLARFHDSCSDLITTLENQAQS
jgi:hypothetical protein